MRKKRSGCRWPCLKTLLIRCRRTRSRGRASQGMRRKPREEEKRGSPIKSEKRRISFERAAATFVRRGGRELLPIVVRTGINVGKKAREEGWLILRSSTSQGADVRYWWRLLSTSTSVLAFTPPSSVSFSPLYPLPGFFVLLASSSTSASHVSSKYFTKRVNRGIRKIETHPESTKFFRSVDVLFELVFLEESVWERFGG